MCLERAQISPQSPASMTGQMLWTPLPLMTAIVVRLSRVLIALILPPALCEPVNHRIDMSLSSQSEHKQMHRRARSGSSLRGISPHSPPQPQKVPAILLELMAPQPGWGPNSKPLACTSTSVIPNHKSASHLFPTPAPGATDAHLGSDVVQAGGTTTPDRLSGWNQTCSHPANLHRDQQLGVHVLL